MRVEVMGILGQWRGGTGSCPPGWRGWQRPIRRAASQLPRSGPKRSIAPIAYSEQVGVKRQRWPSIGLIQRLYPRREMMRNLEITRLVRRNAG